MVKVIRQGAYYKEGRIEKESQAFMTSDKKAKAIKNTLSYAVLKAHAIGTGEDKGFRFDAMISDEESYASVVMSARAVGFDAFPIAYTVLGGNHSCDLQRFTAETAVHYGANYVPAALADETGYLAECGASCGEMILSTGIIGIGAVGAMGVWADETDCLEQVLQYPYVCASPEIVAVYIKGKLRKGVGATDVALSLFDALKNGFADGKILEFIGPGVANLSMESRTVIDKTACGLGCFSTIWQTDELTQEYYAEHGKKGFKKLQPAQPAFYDGAVTVDLSRVEPMISVGENVYEIAALQAENLPLSDCIYADAEGNVHIARAEIFDGTYEDLATAAEIVRGKHVSFGHFSVSAATATVLKGLSDNGYLGLLAEAGICVGTSGGESDLCMDARSFAATVANGGVLSSALETDYTRRLKKHNYSESVYDGVYHGAGKPNAKAEIKDDCFVLSEPEALKDHVLLKVGETLPADPASEIGELKIAKKTQFGCATLLDGISSEDELATVAKEFSEEHREYCAACGVLPLVPEKCELKEGDYLYLDGIAEAIRRGDDRIVAKRISRGRQKDIVIRLASFTEKEKQMLFAGGLIGYYRSKRSGK